MKKRYYVLLGGLLALSAKAVASDTNDVEEPEYTLLSQAGDFELRRYEPQLVAQTWVSGDKKTASRAGFKVLADYIFGNNTAPSGDSSKISMTAPVTMQPNSDDSDKDAQKIAMTAPVNMQQADGQWRIQFTMPKKYTMQTLPKPNNPNITITEIPKQTYAVITFSGLAGSKKVATKTEALRAWMQEQGLPTTGEAQLAQYNPPWTLPFMRRNEILIAYEPE